MNAHDPRTSSYRAAGSALAKMLAAAPHSAHRKAEEAGERMEPSYRVHTCPTCKGAGYLQDDPDRTRPATCDTCDGKGEFVEDIENYPFDIEPDLPESEADKRADDAWYEEDADRYLMDLNREDAA